MVRDWNLIRDVLKACEQDRLDAYVAKSGADYDEDDLSPQELDKLALENAKKYRKLVLGHLELCIDEGFIKGIEIVNYTDGTLGSVSFCKEARLTMKGHDFLAKLRDKNMWKSIKAIAKQTGIVLTVESIGQLASHIVQNTFKD